MQRSADDLGLNDDARALIKAAGTGHALPERERQRIILSFRERLEASERPASQRWLSSAASFAARAFGGGRARVPSRPMAWAAAGLLITGSVAAFGGWSAVLHSVEPLLGNAASESPPPERGARSPAPRRAPLPPHAAEPHEAEPQAAVPPEAVPRAADHPVVPSAREPSPALPTPPRREPPARAPLAQRASSAARAASRVRSLGPELDGIIEARDALRRGEFDRARELTRRLAAAFPHGDLREERAAIEALADCRETGASERGAAFVQRWPTSVLSPRVSADCKLVPNVVPDARPRATQ